MIYFVCVSSGMEGAYSAIIEDIVEAKEPGFYKVKTDLWDFTAHELFFILHKQKLRHKLVTIVSTVHADILKILLSNATKAYEYKKDLYDAFVEREEAVVRDANDIIHVKKDKKIIKEYITQSENKKWIAYKMENDAYQQKKYKNLRKDIDPCISYLCWVPKGRDIKTLSVEDMAKIVLAQTFMKAIYEIKNIEKYFSVRDEQRWKDEYNENLLSKLYDKYNTSIGWKLQFPLKYKAFLSLLDTTIKKRQEFMI